MEWLLTALVLSLAVLGRAQFSLGPTFQCSCELPETVVFTLSNSRNGSGHWNTEITARQQVCQRDGAVTNLEPTVTAHQERDGARLRLTAHIGGDRPRLDPDYEEVDGLGFYKVHTEGQTWEQARRTCASEGAHLVIINSEEEATAVQNMFPQHADLANVASKEVIFAGFHDMYTEGEYLTIFGDSLKSTGFGRWATGQPDNLGASSSSPGQDCGAVHRGGALSDLACDSYHAFICEQETCSS